MTDTLARSAAETAADLLDFAHQVRGACSNLTEFHSRSSEAAIELRKLRYAIAQIRADLDEIETELAKVRVGTSRNTPIGYDEWIASGRDPAERFGPEWGAAS